VTVTIFTQLMNAFDNNVVNLINTGSQNVITLITPLMAACFGVYVSLVMMSYWRGGTDMPIQDFMMKMVAWVVILTMGMNITYYTEYVVPFLNGLGDDLATALSGNVSTGSALDTITNAYVQAMSTLYDHSDGIQDQYGLLHRNHPVLRDAVHCDRGGLHHSREVCPGAAAGTGSTVHFVGVVSSDAQILRGMDCPVPELRLSRGALCRGGHDRNQFRWIDDPDHDDRLEPGRTGHDGHRIHLRYDQSAFTCLQLAGGVGISGMVGTMSGAMGIAKALKGKGKDKDPKPEGGEINKK
jgi:hypothetical protein